MFQAKNKGNGFFLKNKKNKKNMKNVKKIKIKWLKWQKATEKKIAAVSLKWKK